MDHGRLVRRIMEDESFENVCYPDSEGNPTVGWGHLVTLEDGLSLGHVATHEECAYFLATDLLEALDYCYKLIDNFRYLPDYVQEVLVNMMFNLGPNRLMNFKHMFAAIALGDWDGMAREMEDSLWYHQVGDRAVRLKNIVLRRMA